MAGRKRDKEDRIMTLGLDQIDHRERIIVVGAPDVLVAQIRRRYAAHEVVSRQNPLAGIAELASGRVSAVVVQIAPLERRAGRIVSGFRAGLRNGTRLVLCCEPAAEPVVRGAMDAGADDYLIYPPSDRELDECLGLSGPAPAGSTIPDSAAGASFEELRSLTAVFRAHSGPVSGLAERAACFLRETLRNSGIRIECGALRGLAGDRVRDPVWVETFDRADGLAGRILIGPRPKIPFDHADVEKVRIYAGIIGALFDAAEMRREWQRLAMTDDLSGLKNRRYLLQVLGHLLARAETERFRITVLIFDIDNFKHYNDEFGHAVGDELIRETGRLFSRCCRSHDIVTRLGGDEFAVVFWDADGPREPGSKHPSDALGVLARFQRELRAHAWHTLGPVAKGRLTISGGLATFPWDARNPDELLRRADEALLMAKRGGKNRIFLVGQERDDAAGNSEPDLIS